MVQRSPLSRQHEGVLEQSLGGEFGLRVDEGTEI